MLAGRPQSTELVALAIHEETGTVFEDVFDRVGVEVLVDVGAAIGCGFVMAAAEGLGFDGPGVFHPAEMIDVVNKEVAEATAAGPEEAVETADLPHELAAFAVEFRGERGPNRAVHAVAAHHVYFADFTILNTLVQFLHRAAMATHEAHADFEILFRSFLAEGKHAARGGPVHGDGFFHENV